MRPTATNGKTLLHLFENFYRNQCLMNAWRSDIPDRNHSRVYVIFKHGM